MEEKIQKIESELMTFMRYLELMYYKGDGDLRKISQETYLMREKGENVPYMAITDANPVTKQIIRITARPTQKQPDLYLFFSLTAPGSVLPMYQLYIDTEENAVVFKKRLGKGKDNYVIL